MKCNIHSFIHSSAQQFYSRESLCIQHSIECSQTLCVSKHDSRVCRSRKRDPRDREGIQRVPRCESTKIRHVCSISQVFCRVLCSNRAPPSPPPSRAVIHEPREIAPCRSLSRTLAKDPRRGHVVIRSCCVRYPRAREYHVLFIADDTPS